MVNNQDKRADRLACTHRKASLIVDDIVVERLKHGRATIVACCNVEFGVFKIASGVCSCGQKGPTPPGSGNKGGAVVHIFTLVNGQAQVWAGLDDDAADEESLVEFVSVDGEWDPAWMQ